MLARLTLLLIVAAEMAEALPYCGDPRDCDVWCPFGYMQDVHGCDLCSCRNRSESVDEGVECTPPVCLFFRPACDVYAKDARGCDTCECEPASTLHALTSTPADKGVKCRLKPCPFYLPACAVYQKDAAGCETCQCAVAIGDVVNLGRRDSDQPLKEYDP